MIINFFVYSEKYYWSIYFFLQDSAKFFGSFMHPVFSCSHIFPFLILINCNFFRFICRNFRFPDDELSRCDLFWQLITNARHLRFEYLICLLLIFDFLWHFTVTTNSKIVLLTSPIQWYLMLSEFTNSTVSWYLHDLFLNCTQAQST